MIHDPQRARLEDLARLIGGGRRRANAGSLEDRASPSAWWPSVVLS